MNRQVRRRDKRRLEKRSLPFMQAVALAGGLLGERMSRGVELAAGSILVVRHDMSPRNDLLGSLESDALTRAPWHAFWCDRKALIDTLRPREPGIAGELEERDFGGLVGVAVFGHDYFGMDSLDPARVRHWLDELAKSKRSQVVPADPR